jgi:mono/diheme cytochrome c family protein
MVMKLQNLCLAAGAMLFVQSTTVSFAEENAATTSHTEANAGAVSSDDLAIQGQHLYEHNCSHCHGPNMINPGTIAFDLRKFPHNDKDRFVDSVTNGKNGRMPPWGDLLTAADLDRLWAYISSYKQP